MDQRERRNCIPPGGEPMMSVRPPAIDTWLTHLVFAIERTLMVIPPYDRAMSAAISERARNIAQILTDGEQTVDEVTRAIMAAMGVDNGAGVVPGEYRYEAAKSVLKAWIAVRPEPAATPEPPAEKIDYLNMSVEIADVLRPITANYSECLMALDRIIRAVRHYAGEEVPR